MWDLHTLKVNDGRYQQLRVGMINNQYLCTTDA